MFHPKGEKKLKGMRLRSQQEQVQGTKCSMRLLVGETLSNIEKIDLLGHVKKKDVSRPDIYKKKRRAVFFCYLLFPFACFLYTLLPSQRDTSELLGQILIKRNIRY